LADVRLSDGGDARCMSQLYIIEEYMHRLGYKPGQKVLPCEHFDLIAAVDSSRQVIYPANLLIWNYNRPYFNSSSIAIFLGLFGMSVEDAQDAFRDVYSAVFKNESDSQETRPLILENEIKKLLDAHDIPHTKRMSDFSSSGWSKVYVLIPNAYLTPILHVD
jgi:hypothetical protein